MSGIGDYTWGTDAYGNMIKVAIPSGPGSGAMYEGQANAGAYPGYVGFGTPFNGTGTGSNGLNLGNWNWNGILGGVQTLGGLALGGLQAYTNLSALNAQKDALRWQKDIAYNNLNNSIQSYNNRLTDIMQARAAMETGDKNAYDDQIAERSLQRNGE